MTRPIAKKRIREAANRARKRK